MKKLQQSYQGDDQNQFKKYNYLDKIVGKFEAILEKSEQKKQRIIQKIQSTKERQQIATEKNIQSKVLKCQKKLNLLEADLEKIDRKYQITKEFSLVYIGISNQSQLAQNQIIETQSQSQRNENYKILCQLKRQAINLQSKVYKQKHLEPLNQACHNCNQLLNQYLTFGVDQKFQQPDIFNIEIEANQQLNERQKFRVNGMPYQQNEIQYPSQYKQNDEKFKQKKKEGSQYFEDRKYKQQQFDNQFQPKRFLQQQQGDKNANQFHKRDYNQPQQKQDVEKQSDMMVMNQFEDLKINDKKQDNQINNQQFIKQESTVSNDTDSKLCQICFEFPKEYVAIPCGHFIYCQNCKNLVQKQCLMCREPIQVLIKVFQ